MEKSRVSWHDITLSNLPIMYVCMSKTWNKCQAMIWCGFVSISCDMNLILLLPINIVASLFGRVPFSQSHPPVNARFWMIHILYKTLRGRPLIIWGAWCKSKKFHSEGRRKKKISFAEIRTTPPPQMINGRPLRDHFFKKKNTCVCIMSQIAGHSVRQGEICQLRRADERHLGMTSWF